MACYKMAIKKHTRYLGNHKYGGNPQQLAHDLSIVDSTERKMALREDQISHDELLSCSNLEIDKAIISNFYDAALTFMLGKPDAHQVMRLLAEEFLDNERGNALTQEIFSCSVEELHDVPLRYTSCYERHSSRSLLSHVTSEAHLEPEQIDLNRQAQQALN